MARHLLLASLLAIRVTALRQPQRVHACTASTQPTQALHRRAAAAPALAFLAALATPAATALPPPEGCKWTGEGTNRRRNTLSTRLSPFDARRRIPRPQVRPGRQTHQREPRLQRELREGVWRVRVHRDAGHPRLSSGTSEPKEMICTFSGSAAAPAASAPSTAAAPRTNYDDEKSRETPGSAPRASARRPRT